MPWNIPSTIPGHPEICQQQQHNVYKLSNWAHFPEQLETLPTFMSFLHKN